MEGPNDRARELECDYRGRGGVRRDLAAAMSPRWRRAFLPTVSGPRTSHLVNDLVNRSAERQSAEKPVHRMILVRSLTRNRTFTGSNCPSVPEVDSGFSRSFMGTFDQTLFIRQKSGRSYRGSEESLSRGDYLIPGIRYTHHHE